MVKSNPGKKRSIKNPTRGSKVAKPKKSFTYTHNQHADLEISKEKLKIKHAKKSQKRKLLEAQKDDIILTIILWILVVGCTASMIPVFVLSDEYPSDKGPYSVEAMLLLPADVAFIACAISSTQRLFKASDPDESQKTQTGKGRQKVK